MLAVFFGVLFKNVVVEWVSSLELVPSSLKLSPDGGVGGGYSELHLRTLTSAYPVLLCLLDRVAPVDSLQTVEQALRVSRCAQTPLLHLLLHDGEAAALAHAVHHFVVGKHRA